MVLKKDFFEKIPLTFDIENWLWKYNFGTFWWTIIHRRIVLWQFSLSMLILGQKSCIIGPTIFKIPQPNWHYYIYPYYFHENYRSTKNLHLQMYYLTWNSDFKNHLVTQIFDELYFLNWSQTFSTMSKVIIFHIFTS